MSVCVCVCACACGYSRCMCRFVIHRRELTSSFLFHPEMRKTFQTWHRLIEESECVYEGFSLCVCVCVSRCEFLCVCVSAQVYFMIQKRTGQVTATLKSLPWLPGWCRGVEHMKKNTHGWVINEIIDYVLSCFSKMPYSLFSSAAAKMTQRGPFVINQSVCRR